MVRMSWCELKVTILIFNVVNPVSREHLLFLPTRRATAQYPRRISQEDQAATVSSANRMRSSNTDMTAQVGSKSMAGTA